MRESIFFLFFSFPVATHDILQRIFSVKCVNWFLTYPWPFYGAISDYRCSFFNQSINHEFINQSINHEFISAEKCGRGQCFEPGGWLWLAGDATDRPASSAVHTLLGSLLISFSTAIDHYWEYFESSGFADGQAVDVETGLFERRGAHRSNVHVSVSIFFK